MYPPHFLVPNTPLRYVGFHFQIITLSGYKQRSIYVVELLRTTIMLEYYLSY